MYSLTYARAKSLAEARDLLAKNPDAKLLAGGMSLLPTLKARLASPPMLIDIGQIADLKGISMKGDKLFVGAGTRHADVARSDVVKKAIPALAHLASNIGDPQVRNQGTMGGSVAHNDPVADYPSAVVALNATIQTMKKEIAGDGFFKGMFDTTLEAGDIITGFLFPVPKRAAYQKFPHPASGYAMTGVFVADFGGTVRVAVTGAGPGVFRWKEAEAALAKDFSAKALDGLKVAADGLNTDIHASAEYRANLVKVMAQRAVAAASGSEMMSAVFKGRREDKRLMTGGGRYTADWNVPGQLYAAFLRADRPHAEIRSINIKPALEHPGVAAVLTGEDTAHFKNPATLVQYPGRAGFQLKLPHRSVLARGRVRYVGEEVALVVASTPGAAEDAVEKIEIDYNDLPPVTDAEAALADGAPQLYPDIPGNQCFDFEYGDEAKTEEAFKSAAHVTRLQLESQRVSGNPMEPKACLASYDAGKDSYEVWSSSQGITMMKGGFASWGISPQNVRFVAQDVGGGFGIRGGVYPEFVAVMAAAKKLGKPVKWVGSRGESFASDSHGRAIRLWGELALDKDGKFLAIRYRWICNQGAYLTGAGPLINTITPKLTPVGVYRIPTVYGRHHLAMTNTTPTGPYRGAGRPDNAYLIDRLVEQAAREMNIDRTELRRRNFIPKDAFPYKTPTGIPYDSGDYEGLMNEVLERSEWKSFEARREEAKKRGKLRGIGLAVFIEPAGAGGPPKDQAMLKFGSSGELEIFSVTGPSGQGHETVFPEIVGRELGIDPELITLRASDPGGPPLIGGGTVGSRSMSAHGGASVLAAREVIKKGMDLAAKDLEVAASDLEYVEGKFKVKGTDKSIGLVELARKHAAAGATHPLDSTGDNPVVGTFPSGAHVAEVEVDPLTGVTQVIRYTGVDDCGAIINHTLLEGQMHGGIAQGAGQVFGEDMKYDDETGQLLTGSFMDYYMPKAGLLGDIRLYDRPVKSPNNPLGVKGAGEAGTTGSLPTLMNAVLDALRPAGVTHLDMPATPSRVWQVLQDAKK